MPQKKFPKSPGKGKTFVCPKCSNEDVGVPFRTDHPLVRDSGRLKSAYIRKGAQGANGFVKIGYYCPICKSFYPVKNDD